MKSFIKVMSIVLALVLVFTVCVCFGSANFTNVKKTLDTEASVEESTQESEIESDPNRPTWYEPLTIFDYTPDNGEFVKDAKNWSCLQNIQAYYMRHCMFNGTIDTDLGEYYELTITGYIDGKFVDPEALTEQYPQLGADDIGSMLIYTEDRCYSEYWFEGDKLPIGNKAVTCTATFGTEGINPTEPYIYVTVIAGGGEVHWSHISFKAYKARYGTPPESKTESIDSQVSEEPSEQNSEEKSSEEVSSDVKYGDCNGDSNIDLKDVLMLRKSIAGLGNLTVSEAADVNGDGNIDLKDVLMLRKYIAAMIDTLGPTL